METVIAQLTFQDIIHFSITILGSVVMIILMLGAFAKYKDDSFIFIIPILFFILGIFLVYRVDDFNNIKAKEYANTLKQYILKSQNIITVDKEKLNKSYLNEVELSLIKENYKPVRENDQFVYFQKCSNKS